MPSTPTAMTGPYPVMYAAISRYPDPTARNFLPARCLPYSVISATWWVSAWVSTPAMTFMASFVMMEPLTLA